jgi:multidrug resistance efflux pump
VILIYVFVSFPDITSNDSEIGGVNTAVAQIQSQLENAEWELSRTLVRAPADCYVTLVTLTVGDRALQARSFMSFVVENEITIVGMLSPPKYPCPTK